ncbi:hypothetical protein [Dysgonomonas sp. ZJ279]|uniref:hypothetical protein n=1 Tax=Dysgonomonas sp. ZJ279 TaxID=2709796 RepID=UPI0013ED3C40|nr:hypothetical protein [Dysgonomonas sp. ZJ279]
MKILKFKIEGVCPLLQHDDKTANPFNEYTKQLKAISAKRKKTEDDLLEMARIEWLAGLYYTEQSGYFMKAECFEGAFLGAAKAKKLGKTFKEAVSIPDNPTFHFEHEKLAPAQLFEMDEYKDFRTIKIQRSKVLRCRPIFGKWNCDVEIWYEETRLDEHEIIDIVNYAGRYIGICDYRPKYGRFQATEIK